MRSGTDNPEHVKGKSLQLYLYQVSIWHKMYDQLCSLVSYDTLYSNFIERTFKIEIYKLRLFTRLCLHRVMEQL